MSESDLDTLLEKGERRLRADGALRWALIVLGFASLGVAASLFVWRTVYAVPAAQAQSVQISQALWALMPFALAALSFSTAFVLARPGSSRVAAALDSSAGLQDHILSWHQLRGQKLNGVAADFRAAQTRATLERANGLALKKLLPIRLPSWSPALWLALVGLCCALLVPPRVDVETNAAARERELSRRRNAALALSAGADGATERGAANTPRVQTLSPTELLKLQLRVTDPNLSNEQRKQLLAELEQKTGGIPESELTEEVREILRELRGAEKASGLADAGAKAGSSQLKAVAEPPTASAPSMQATNDAQLRERGISSAQRTFTDVKDELNRYYSGGTRK